MRSRLFRTPRAPRYNNINYEKKQTAFNIPIAKRATQFINNNSGNYDLMAIEHTGAKSSQAMIDDGFNGNILAFSGDRNVDIPLLTHKMKACTGWSSNMYKLIRRNGKYIIIHDGQQYGRTTLVDMKIILDQHPLSVGLAVNIVPRCGVYNGKGRGYGSHNVFLEDVVDYANELGYNVKAEKLASYSQYKNGSTMWPFWFEMTKKSGVTKHRRILVDLTKKKK